MYEIYFYKEHNGKMPVKELIKELRNRKDKDSRINLNKIMDTLNKLTICGLNIGMPYIRRIEDNIWEIRVNRYRIMFLVYKANTFVLLHYFVKKTLKTPTREKEKAKNEVKTFLKEGQNE